MACEDIHSRVPGNCAYAGLYDQGEGRRPGDGKIIVGYPAGSLSSQGSLIVEGGARSSESERFEDGGGGT